MRRSTAIIAAILLVVALTAFVVFAIRSVPISSAKAPLDEPNSSISVVFCPECGDTFDNRIAGGGTIHCALYDVGKDTGAILERVHAQVITDDETKPAYGELYRHSGLMHNKFCVVNESVVITGSYNPTDNGEKNQNNVLTIYSKRLATNYEAQFQALAQEKTRGKIAHTGTIGGIKVENYFCPQDNCEARVLDVLRSAQQEVLFMTYSFTSDPIGELLVQKKAEGIKVEGTCDKSQQNDFTECTKLGAKTWTGGGLLHHKVFIIDKSIVVTGSYNPTANGNKNNDENVLIIHDAAIAQQFITEYNRMMAGST